MILGVHIRSCSNMVYGELARFPLDIIIKKRAVGFWARILDGKEAKLTRLVYTQFRHMYNNNHFKSEWFEFIKNILEDCNLSETWRLEEFTTVDRLKTAVHNVLKEKFINKWTNDIQNMTSCDTYANFKTKFTLEEYLTYLPPMSRLSFCRFRLNNTRLPKVLGRYTQTPREQRFCTLCINDGLIGDEFHLLLECSHPQLAQLRSKYINTSFTIRPSMQKCIELIGNENPAIIRKLAMFLKYSLKLLR